MTSSQLKTAKFSDFTSFYAIFVKFSMNFGALNVENVQKGKIRCRRGFLEEIKAIFQREIVSKSDRNF